MGNYATLPPSHLQDREVGEGDGGGGIMSYRAEKKNEKKDAEFDV